MTLPDFLNRHAGESAWLFGKGPSLSQFDFKTAGPLRAAINDVIAHVPNCKYGFSNDGIRAWRDVYRPGQILFQPTRCLHEYDSTEDGAVLCDVVTYPDSHDDHRLFYTRENLACGLSIRRGTLGSALQILHIMGVTTIHFVGIDGGRAHADGFAWRTELRSDHGNEYNAIRNEAIDSCVMMGIKAIFHNQSNPMEQDGKIFVKFLSNCFADQIPYCTGQVVRLNPRVAFELFHEGAAERFYPPTQVEKPEPVIERAEAPMAARESATVKTTKGRKK